MNHWRTSKYPLGLAALLGSACQSVPEDSRSSFFDKLNGVNGVSESLAQSRQLGLLLRPLRCMPARLVLGDSVNLDIREAYLEKGWQCGPGCASVRALNESDRNVQLVLKCTPGSKIDHLNIYWFLNPGDQESGFYETGNGGLVSQQLSPKVTFPLTYYLFTLDKDGKRHIIGSFVLR